MSKSPNPKAGGQVKTPKKAAIENTEPGKQTSEIRLCHLS